MEAIIRGLVALCQREGILSTDSGELIDTIQSMAADEVYISANEIEMIIE